MSFTELLNVVSFLTLSSLVLVVGLLAGYYLETELKGLAKPAATIFVMFVFVALSAIHLWISLFSYNPAILIALTNTQILFGGMFLVHCLMTDNDLAFGLNSITVTVYFIEIIFLSLTPMG